MSPARASGRRKIVHIGIDDGLRHNTRTCAEFAVLLREYTDWIEWGDAYAILDVTDNKLDIPFGMRVAKMIKSDIKRQLGWSVSVGLAPSKFLAQLAMERQRPDGLTVVLPEQIGDFLADVPIDRLPGVGAVTRQQFAAMQIEHIGALAQVPLNELVRRFGQRGSSFWHLAQGWDDDPVAPAEQLDQIREETSFAAPLYTREEMHDALRELAAALGGRLQRRGLQARDVTLAVHYPDFRTATRTSRLAAFTDRAQVVSTAACELLEHTEAYDLGTRLLGIGLGGFNDEEIEQLDLFASEKP
jgi:DNA polymerase-4